MLPSGNPPDGRDAGGGGEPQALREQIAENQRTIDRLNRDLSSRSNDVRTIQQISTEITSSLDLDEVLVIVLGAMQRILGFEHSMILLKDLAAPRSSACSRAAATRRAAPAPRSRSATVSSARTLTAPAALTSCC